MASGKTDHALERLVFFSDAVFAIAITLLVIEIHVPDVPYRAPPAAYWEALAHLIPSFVSFAISFGVIGMFWSGHHRAFSLAERYHGGVLGWNLLLLGAIAFMPFVTALFGKYYGAPVPTGIYWAWLVLTALLNLKVNTIATGPAMLGEGAAPEAAADVRRRSRGVALGGQRLRPRPFRAARGARRHGDDPALAAPPRPPRPPHARAVLSPLHRII